MNIFLIVDSKLQQYILSICKNLFFCKFLSTSNKRKIFKKTKTKSQISCAKKLN
ncbi:hypothetical protein KsCSTR_41530 [Candidatus Kuenenia stuttgartiensis]|uniref:Uncharacterized protein n=1 Tax=Kuenenia stuttgartiensis TaxID=174633 RepID=Q1PXM6_KUEST|nr:hypothetical protein KsCSTR_41530 [Candidatus Kuenenia stuttgartiensis]CAJ71982.1 unknown protein [Candidatus Kuenenia stuttgartiensis]